jgi:hypothetical protein
MRLAAALLTAALLAASLAACGSSGSGSETTRGGGGQQSSPAGASAQACAAATRVEGLRVTAASCGEGQRVALAWVHGSDCQPGAGASRAGCRVGSYRCGAVRADRGVAVTCARPGRTVAFVVPRGG